MDYCQGNSVAKSVLKFSANNKKGEKIKRILGIVFINVIMEYPTH